MRALPVLFVCENNLYMEYTPTEDVTPGGDRRRPRALGIPAETVDGNDVFAVREAAARARAQAASGGGPVFLEADDLPHRRPQPQRPGRLPRPGSWRNGAGATRSWPARGR